MEVAFSNRRLQWRKSRTLDSTYPTWCGVKHTTKLKKLVNRSLNPGRATRNSGAASMFAGHERELLQEVDSGDEVRRLKFRW